MINARLFLPLMLGLVGAFLSGCTTTITNLTPTQVPRNSNGIYLFEVALDTQEQAVRKETIKPYVQIGEALFPMKAAPVLKNRWETLVPISPDKEFVHYRYKFDYEYNSIPKRGQGSKLSAPYRLEILQK